MRRRLVFGIVIAMIAAVGVVPAVAGDSAAGNYRSEYNTASATFGDGYQGAVAYMTETVRDDGTTQSYVRLQVYNYGEPFVWCNGESYGPGINGFYIRQNGAHFDADIEVWCAGESQIVHVEATWETEGRPNVNVVTRSGYDDLLEQNTTNVSRYVGPTVSGASLATDADLIGGIPDYADGSISMQRHHTVIPHTEGLP